jgi:hypothetical protein
MNTSDIITVIALGGFMIAATWGTHQFTLRRLVLPMVAGAAVAYHYLHGVPTTGNDVTFIALCGLAGAGFGLLAASQVRMYRDASTGAIMTVAGLGYAAVWTLVFGGRLAFAWAATHTWQTQVAQFSMDHLITGTAWTAAFVVMAMAMIVTRTAVNGARALMLLQGPESSLERIA